jgi:hypothetical protein
MRRLVEERALTITTPLLAAHLKCPTKCWHRPGGKQVTGGTYAQWSLAQNESLLYDWDSPTALGKTSRRVHSLPFCGVRRIFQGYEAVHMIREGGRFDGWQETTFFARFSSSTTFSIWQPEDKR